ncbi:hypothetical protein [Halospina denitrificans]|uniref:hypothetical protein n=1 Tax=Halospina denitrificans TaxID=332522 RepID=UPI001061F5DC|nr:hypothetical protein [Halospina denitrificans]
MASTSCFGAHFRFCRGDYVALVNTSNGNKALEKLNKDLPEDEQFYAINTIALFAKSFRDHYINTRKGKGRQTQLEYLTTKFMKTPKGQSLGVNKSRRLTKEILKNSREDFETVKEYYFFFDLCPKNRERVNIKYEEVIGTIQ